MEGKKILLFGLGFFQKGLLNAISRNRPCVVVDTDADMLQKVNEENLKFVETVEGEASSIVTWKKVNMSDVSHIVCSVQDREVTLEVCRIAREVYSLEIPLIILWYKDEHRKEFEAYNAKVINPLEISVEAVMGLIDKNYSKPTNIGLGQGEVVEVSILRRSHIVERKMKFLNPTRWKVAAAYREGKLIVPDGDFKLQIGDKAILIGEPKIIENIVNILMKGTPEFPLQYGQSFDVLADRLSENDTNEILEFQRKTRSRKFYWHDVEENKQSPVKEIAKLKEAGAINGGSLKNFRSAAYLKDAGLVALSGKDKFSIFNIRMRYFFKKSLNPFLICRGNAPYSEILVSLNGKIPDRLVEIGAELASLFNTFYRFVYVVPPGALKTAADEAALKVRQNIITDFENLTRTKINFSMLEGNPVREILKMINGKKDTLLVVSSDSSESISFMSPHVSYILAAKSQVSVLVLPDEGINE